MRAAKLDDYLAGWSRLHGGYRPTGLTRRYLRLVHAAAQPLQAVPPDVLTGIGVLIALAALLPAWLGGSWAALAAVVIAVSGVADSLDGAVAVLTGRSTRWGYVIDSVSDRVADLAYLGALWLLGAPAWLCVGAGAALFLLEYTRARANAAAMDELAIVTVGERPTRILIIAVFALYGAAVDPVWYDLAAAAIVGLSLGGLTQLLVAVRRSGLLGGR